MSKKDKSTFFKRGELLPKDDLYELYMTQNKSEEFCAKYFNVGRGKVRCSLKAYGFTKTKEMKLKSRIQSSLEKYGTTHPRLNKEVNKSINEKTKNTCLKKYGVDSPSKQEEIKQKIKQTCIERYGTQGVMSLPEFKEKAKQTCIEKYGVQHSSQSKMVKEKKKKTNLEKYGQEAYFQTDEFKEKSKQTCLEKYGVNFITQSEQVKEKIKQTCKEKYNTEWAIQSKEVREKGRETWQNKYNTDLYTPNEDIKEKAKKTNQERYGYDYASQSPEFRKRVAKINLERFGNSCNLASVEGIAKKTVTWLKNMGVNHPSKCPEVVEKQWKSRKKNATTNTSKLEEYMYSRLIEKYSRVKRNYKSDLYPFHCDFYIPLIDTYIECQGFEGHGKHPFNPQNPDDVALLMTWAEKADKKKLDRRNKYLAYVITWIEKDPLKRAYAKTNRLRFFEFFTKEEFDTWYNSQ